MAQSNFNVKLCMHARRACAHDQHSSPELWLKPWEIKTQHTYLHASEYSVFTVLHAPLRST